MGIPKFFRWLTRRYPMILQNIQQEEDCPPSDNLYLDLNSIVHNCIHGNDPKRHERISKLSDLEEVWADIMRAIDEIVHMVKPKKLILLAVDGVAPRAKMNQQRARRFRSAKDSQELKTALQAAGKEVAELFDSNQISPGTKFMHELGVQLEWFVKYKLNTDPIYMNCERVVLSDSSVPGEGEHKMMDYIRNIKMSPDYDPNTRHCFYGSDADLIMLSLLTHEPHFMIIREEHVIRKTKQGGVQRIDIARTANLQLIHISLLREYIMLEYRPLAPQMKMKFQLERIIDDFIFFCFFIGNDFLPSLSALDIGEGSLDHLINFYKKCLPQMTDYITFEGQIYWDRAEPFIELLGKHEHQVFINRVKTLDSQYNDSKNLITFTDSHQTTAGHMTTDDKTRIIQQQIKAKIKEKKTKKCAQLFSKNKQKNYKKFQLLKKFDEDYEEEMKTEGDEYVKYQSLKQKYKKLRSAQNEKDKNAAVVGDENEGLHSIISEIREEFMSDLNPDDIPNSDISDISESEIVKEGEDMIKLLEQEQNMDNKIDLVKKQSEIAIEKNHTFMKDFVNTYKDDSNEAKRNYYNAKLKFDVKEVKGKVQLQKLLFRYLEGLQWVLYYYYKGAPHWRWYYPYHYAPMISDLGSNIVRDFLGGINTITEFKTDTHCNINPKPYTPFQQLLCIFPVKSLRQFLPSEYLKLAEGELQEFFCDDFEIDLNGRTLPWEAAILIPFVDEEIFIQAEQGLFENGMKLSKEEWKRNTTSFVYPSYHYDSVMAKNKDIPPKPLKSLLTRMDDLQKDFTKMEFHSDYENVGKFAFQSALLKGVQMPMNDYPSLAWLNVQELDYTEKFINKVAFKQCLAIIPSTQEDLSGADFEDWIYKFAEGKNKELYIKFPYQIEAFPLYFEDPFSIYQMAGNASTNQFTVTKMRQTKTREEFDMLCRRCQVNHSGDKGIQLGEKFNTLVTVSPVIGSEYDDVSDLVYKLYSEETMTIPFNLVMRKRGANHYLNINERVNSRIGRVKTNKPVVCFNPGLLGVIGKVKGKDLKRELVKVEFNVEQEESKVHHPFYSENFLRREFKHDGIIDDKPKKSQKPGEEEAQPEKSDKKTRGKNYFGDQEIEQMLKLPKGLVNRLTGSFLIAYDEAGKDDRQVVDCGLNIKNFTKKVHIPDYVRFVAQNSASNNIYDEFNHNQHARGSKHIRKHWEYSADCVQIIEDYCKKYPEIMVAIQKCAKKNKAMNSLFDVYPDTDKKDKSASISKLREVLNWIEQLPVSNLPYVEMGFDSLEQDLIDKLAEHSDYVKQNYGSINLNVNPVEQLGLAAVYQEGFPYWTGPQSIKSTVTDFRVGNRVMNLNSTKRQYIPFGARGIVVGKTDSKLIVMFDDQFLHGNDIYGHCQMYRGAQVEPHYMLNLSREFARLTKDDYQAVKKFQEKPLEGCALFADENEKEFNADNINLREQHLVKKFSSTESKPAKSNDEKPQKAKFEKVSKEKTHAEANKKHESQKNRPRAEEPEEEKQKAPEKAPEMKMVYKAKPFVPKAAPESEPVTAQTAAAPEESKGAPISFSLGQSGGQLFGSLPGLKVLDPKLMTQPQFQKIIQMQDQSQEDKKPEEQKKD